MPVGVFSFTDTACDGGGIIARTWGMGLMGLARLCAFQNQGADYKATSAKRHQYRHAEGYGRTDFHRPNVVKQSEFAKC